MNYYAERHLILVNKPGWQARGDFELIKERIIVSAPEIEVFIATSTDKDEALAELAAKRPTLCVSFSPLDQFMPLRGRVYAGRGISKSIQLELLAAQGIAVPKSVLLTEGVTLDPKIFGPVVLLKPSTIAGGSKGKGMALVPTEQVKYRPPESYPEEHPASKAPLLAQQFIDTGDNVSAYRVLTLLGEVIYCLRIQVDDARPALSSIVEETTGIKIATNTSAAASRDRRLVEDEDVLQLARRCQEAEPTTPLKGIDIVREQRTGKLYVLELNTVSNTWHISSDSLLRNNLFPADQIIAQFGAFDVAARVLVDRCRDEAL